MSTIMKVKSLLADADVRSFIKYSAVHPMTILKRSSIPKYPDFIENEDLVIENDFKNNVSISKLTFADDDNRKIDYAISDDIKVHLAGIDDVIDIRNIEWFKQYEDSEDVAALHRFLWLYRMMWEVCYRENIKLNKQIKRVIYDWIDKVESIDKKKVHSEVWQTYSVVERITSWVISLGLTESEDDYDAKIVDSIIRQLDHIQNNFEYYGKKFTSNHFFNDGKGLYICGAILKHKKYRELGKKIIKGMFDEIVPDGIFLREGSSHYQFLVTKWLCDCLWIARETDDSGFEEWLKARLFGMMSGCQFFMNKNKDKWVIPFIGDISPDCCPEWIIGVPWVASYLVDNSIYEGMPNNRGYHSVLPRKDTVPYYSTVRYKGSNDWGKIQNDLFTIYSHVNNSLYPNNLTGHFHHDSGSIVVYANNKPLLIDCGRTNYSMEGIGAWGKSYKGHNICIVDEMSPEPDMRSFYSEGFIANRFGQAPTMECDETHIQIKIEYGKRVKNLESQLRSVRFNRNEIIIEDKVYGKGEHDIKLFFHINNSWKVVIKDGVVLIDDSIEKYLIWTEGVSYSLAENVDDNSFYGSSADEYGAQKRCTTIVGNTRTAPEKSIVTIIERK